MPFPVRVEYRDRRRVGLWTMPFLVDGGRVVLYQAFGPAGTPASMDQMASVDMRRLPYGARLHVPTVCDAHGRDVYAQARHTMN